MIIQILQSLLEWHRIQNIEQIKNTKDTGENTKKTNNA